MTIPPISLEAANSPSVPTDADDTQGTLPKQRPLLWTMFFANFGMATLWGAIGSIFLAVQLQTLNPENKIGSLSLAIGLGAVGAMIASPIAGTLSDRTRTRIGGRAPWMIAGLVVTIAATVFMAFATSTLALIVGFVVVQVGTSFVASPLIAHIPDRVPTARRGIFSSINGLGTLVGAIAGQTVGAAFAGSIPTGYIVVAVLFGIAISVFLIVNARQSNVGVPREQYTFVDLLHTFWVNPIKYPDFFWAFAGRLLIITGYYLVSSFGLYILQDYIGLGDAAVSQVPVVGAFVLVGIIVSTIIAGPLSDKVGRTKGIHLHLFRHPCGVDPHPLRLADPHRNVRVRHLEWTRIRCLPGRRLRPRHTGASVPAECRQRSRHHQHHGDPAADLWSRGGRSHHHLRWLRRAVPDRSRDRDSRSARDHPHPLGSLGVCDEVGAGRRVGRGIDREHGVGEAGRRDVGC